MENISGWVLFMSSGWKGHWCPAELLPGLMEDSSRRGHGMGSYEPAERGLIDLPGMVMVDRSIQTFDIGGFKLRIPTEDTEQFYFELRSNKERVFSDGRKYFKIHGWIHCVVMTPEQRLSLLREMETRMDDVKRITREETHEFQRRISQVNSGGVRIMTSKAPESMPKIPVSGTPNDEKN